MGKQLNIGLRQARRLCQMPHEERLAFLFNEKVDSMQTSDLWGPICFKSPPTSAQDWLCQLLGDLLPTKGRRRYCAKRN